MNQKFEKEKFFDMFENGLTTEEIVATTGASRKTVTRAKNEWKNGRSFTPKEKIAAADLTASSRMIEVGGEISRLEPIVLNAIYRIDKWQTIFFSGDYNAYFDGEDKLHKHLYDFLKWSVKKCGYMPSQDRISEMWDSAMKNSKTQFSEEDREELYDLFDKIIWNIDEDVTWLDEICERYITMTESMIFIDRARKLLVGEGTVGELRDLVTKLSKQIDIPGESFTNLADEINGNVSMFYPFFVPQLNEKIKGLPTGVNVLCGMTGSGKTMACINQEVFLAKQQIPSIHFVLGDLTNLEYQCRVLSHLSQIEYYKIIRDGGLQQQLRAQYRDILQYITISVSTSGKTIDGYLRDIEKLRKRQANNRQPIANFVVFDYDDLIGTVAVDEWKRAEEIYVAAQKYGMDNGCCILMVSQPTKESETAIRKGDRTLQLTDISGGRKKANVAAVALGFSVKKSEDPNAELKPVKVEVLKGRNGGYGTTYDCFFDGNRCSYILGLTPNEKFEEFNGFENELDELPFG